MIVYQFLSIILSPLVYLYLLHRKFKKKEDPLRFSERFGYSKIVRPQGNLVWLHAASVGESKSALTFANALLEKYPSINILLTSGTVTSASEIAKNLPPRTIHQFIPVDIFYAVKRFINHWKPNLAIFVESELWPNLVYQTNKSGCQLILLNGRISDESFESWKNLQHFGLEVIDKFSLCFVQSELDKEKFTNLGAKEVKYVGNLKAAATPLKIDEEKLSELTKQIDRPFWLASSTHKGEEEIIIRTHKKLENELPNLLTIIALRHPTRLKEVLKLIPSDLEVSVRSRGDKIDNCDIYIVDTLGELGTFYSLSKISLICGSLIDKIGGHNPFEALQLGSVILSGIYVKNFAETYLELEKSGFCLMPKNEGELFSDLLKLLKDEDFYSSRLENIQNFKMNKDKILSDILKIIENNNLIKL